MPDGVKDHLFISYASEDFEFARWLTLKLTSYGYKVWCDRFKQLGGEPYPTDIDEAIKDDTFRLLAVVSRKSNSKQNPVKERTLALNLSKDRGVKDFVIPLNLDGISPSEINWMMSDITFISFYNSWAAGFEQLLKKLNSISAPKPLTGGKDIVAEGFLQNDVLTSTPEMLYTNYIPFVIMPDTIKSFETELSLGKKEETEWAFYKIDSKKVVSFASPPNNLVNEFYISHKMDLRPDSDFIHNVPTRNIISNLLLRSIELACYKSGMVRFDKEEKSIIYLPKDMLKNNRINFIGYNGTKGWVKSCGERKRHSKEGETRYRFHLSPKFKISVDGEGNYYAKLKVGLFITDLNGDPLKTKAANARRKSICKDWWNYEWLNRHIAILSLLAGEKENITIGEKSEEQITISIKFIEKEAAFGIDEERIKESWKAGEDNE